MPEAELDLASARADAFRTRFGQATFDLACHAAFPLALTPDLLTHLWQDFDRDIHRLPLNTPWVAIADILLSDLCNEVGTELYEMKLPVRRVLLDALKTNSRYGSERLRDLSDFLQVYVREQLKSTDAITQAYGQAQEWTALAAVDSEQAAAQVANALKASIETEDVDEQLRLVAITEALADEFSSYQPLLEYARNRRELLQGHPDTAPGTATGLTTIAGIEMPSLATRLPTPTVRELGPSPHVPPYIFGLCGWGGEQELLAANKPGWVVVMATVHQIGTPYDFSALAAQGLGVIVVLVNGIGREDTLPVPAQYDEFAAKCADVVRGSSGARIWVIGNEPNTAFARPQNTPITPDLYARCFNKCRQAIRVLPGHERDWVVPAAVAPFVFDTQYAGNATGDWVKYFADMLTQIQAQGGGLDAVALHAASPSDSPVSDGIFTEGTYPPPFQANRQGWLAYRDFISAIPSSFPALPILITEASPISDGQPLWLDEDNGWVQAAFADVDGWNREHDRLIYALCLREWDASRTMPDRAIANKPRLLADLRAALHHEYRVPGAAVRPSGPREVPPDEMFDSNSSYALIIQVSKYQHFEETPYIVDSDAWDLHRVLTDPKLCGYRPENVTLLLNGAATKDAILAVLARLAQVTESNSTILVYFAGYSLRIGNKPGSLSFLIPFDADPSRLAQSAFSATELLNGLSQLSAQRVASIFDTVSPRSFSVRLEDDGSQFAQSLTLPSIQSLPPSGLLRNIATIQSARDYENAFVHTPGKTSLFTHHLLNGLQGNLSGADGTIRILDLFKYVSARVSADEPGQHPLFSGPGTNFPIALYRGGVKQAALEEIAIPPESVRQATEGHHLDNSLLSSTMTITGVSPFRRSIAVVIGIDDYDDNGAGIPRLTTAVADATELARRLSEAHGYEIIQAFDKVTKDWLRTLFAETLPSLVGPDDRVLVYFAGHGIALDSDDGPAGFLLPQDASWDDGATFLPIADMNDWLSALPCRHGLVILDCYFAGAFHWASTQELVALPKIIYKERYDRFIEEPAWQMLTSTVQDQKALDFLGPGLRGSREVDGVDHSPFALALYNALDGAADLVPIGAGDGIITATELYLYLRDNVEFEGQDHSRYQVTPGLWPLKKHGQGEFIFLVPGHELNLPPAPELTSYANPYRGLRPYGYDDSPFFFGRDDEINALVALVAAQPFVAVLGASDTGKSSLVQAGLLPRLRSLPGYTVLASMRPGEHPVQALQHLLREALPDAAGATYREPDEVLFAVLEVWRTTHRDGQIVLNIDQFEELITLCRDEKERQGFLSLLARAIAGQPGTLRVVITLRSDFEAQFSESPLARHWSAGRYVIPPLDQTDLLAVIEGPASVMGLHFDPPELVDDIINEVIHTPGALPLLSFALSEMYIRYVGSHRDDHALTRADYEALGGVIGALRNRANEEFNLLNAAEKDTMKRVMLRMVSAEAGDLTRRRVPLSELVYTDEAENVRVAAVLDRLVAARLLVRGTAEAIDSEPSEQYVEPVHDALVRGWDKLIVWTREAADNLSLQRHLTQAAVAWEHAADANKNRLLWDQDPRLRQLEALLWPESEQSGEPGGLSGLGRRLQQALSPRSDTPLNTAWLNRVEIEFVQASVRRRMRR